MRLAISAFLRPVAGIISSRSSAPDASGTGSGRALPHRPSYSPLVVLFEVNAIGICTFELECDAPWSIDMDRIARRMEPFERVKVETWNVHFLRPHRDVETIQPRKDSLIHLASSFGVRPFLQSSASAFTFEGPDHDDLRKLTTYLCQLFAYIKIL